MPRKHPNDTPSEAPMLLARLVDFMSNCSTVRRGSLNPAFFAIFSTWEPRPTPATSEMVFPIAAAPMVDTVRIAPSSSSIKSPAMIMMELSMKPNPTKGTADAIATIYSCCRVGGRSTSSLFRNISSSEIVITPSLFESILSKIVLSCTLRRSMARSNAKESSPGFSARRRRMCCMMCSRAPSDIFSTSVNASALSPYSAFAERISAVFLINFSVLLSSTARAVASSFPAAAPPLDDHPPLRVVNTRPVHFEGVGGCWCAFAAGVRAGAKIPEEEPACALAKPFRPNPLTNADILDRIEGCKRPPL
mmetsp:Transcript_4831/g.10998  ORF Transcript_4831/g.10998 Transcript_4831/m.10998 type:complete len:306 (-) Transcript_4831:2-919(-)